MAGKLWVPATSILAVALVLSVLASLSLPYLPFMDVTRVSSKSDVFRSAMKEARFGIWAACSWTRDNTKFCSKTGHGYSVIMYALNPKGEAYDTITITPAWTRGLAAHPFGTGTIAIALAASLSTRHTANLWAPLVALFSAALILIVFAIQLALHVHVKVVFKDAFKNAAEGVTVSAGPALWFTLVTLVLVLAAAALMFVHRRREVLSASGYPTLSNQHKGARGILSLFRRK